MSKPPGILVERLTRYDPSNPPVRTPDTRQYSAVRAADGTVWYDPQAAIHAQVVNAMDAEGVLGMEEPTGDGFIAPDGTY
ncbi:MAG: hypothetical protein KAJ19_15300, partial [Gammaproteobacteria bacterium]|nr:hypothetical protein [Gammaproteobacteria bacterium]